MSDLLERSLGAIPVEVTFPLSLPDVLADHNQLRTRNPQPGCQCKGRHAERQRDLNQYRSPVASGTVPGLNAGRYVAISISDTGEGMDEATLAKATEPFLPQRRSAKALGWPVDGPRRRRAVRRTIAAKEQKGEGTTAGNLALPIVEAPPAHAPVAEQNHASARFLTAHSRR